MSESKYLTTPKNLRIVAAGVAQAGAVNAQAGAIGGAPETGDMVALPRVCAIFKKPYMAYYMKMPVGFSHRNEGRLTDGVYNASFYGERNGVVVPGEYIGEELCPWCGTSSHGAIRCGRCKQFCCAGKTANDLFVCACGHADWVRPVKGMEQVGLVL